QKLARNMVEFNALSQTKNNWQSQLWPIIIQKEIALESYGKAHPRVKELERTLQMMTEFHTKSEKNDNGSSLYSGEGDFLKIYMASLKQEHNEAVDREVNLLKIFDDSKTEAKGIERLRSQDLAHRTQIAGLTKLYDGVVERIAEIDLMKGYHGYQVQVLRHAHFGRQTKPVFSIVMGIAGVIGLVGGFGLAFLVDLADKSFRSPDEIRTQLGLPVVAHIPILPGDAGRRKDAAEGVKIHSSIFTAHRPRSREAESYRRVRTAIFFSTRGEPHQIIQVTSPDASDGKTTLAANLCVAVAQSGKSVLLIDADMRRPRMHRLFRVGSAAGLAMVLKDECSLDEAVQPTEIEHLSVLPCGPKPDNPADRPLSKRVRAVLEAARPKFDFVIVDSPPLLAVSDAAVVGAMVDGVLVTIRISKKGRPVSQRAIEQLQSVNANIIGVVVNGVGPHPGYGHYGYGRYTSNYHYYQYSPAYYNYRDEYGYGEYNSYYTEEGEPGNRSGAPAQRGNGNPEQS
ncbi:MAG: polysaccharide biosynthesis tyrosine autokinase, partial [Planctomycetales bacterium]